MAPEKLEDLLTSLLCILWIHLLSRRLPLNGSVSATYFSIIHVGVNLASAMNQTVIVDRFLGSLRYSLASLLGIKNVITHF